MLLHGQFEKLVSAIRMATDDDSDGGEEEEEEEEEDEDEDEEDINIENVVGDIEMEDGSSDDGDENASSGSPTKQEVDCQTPGRLSARKSMSRSFGKETGYSPTCDESYGLELAQTHVQAQNLDTVISSFSGIDDGSRQLAFERAQQAR